MHYQCAICIISVLYALSMCYMHYQCAVTMQYQCAICIINVRHVMHYQCAVTMHYQCAARHALSMCSNYALPMCEWGGSRGGGGNYFSKKNRKRGSRGLGAHFPPAYPGVTPPRIRRTGPPSSDFFGKNILKKNSTWRKKW